MPSRSAKFKLTSTSAERRFRAMLKKRLRKLRDLVEKRALAARTDSFRTDAGYDAASIRRMWVRLAGQPVKEAVSVANTVKTGVDQTVKSAVKSIVPTANLDLDDLDLDEDTAAIAGWIRSLEDDYVEKVGSKLKKLGDASKGDIAKLLREEASRVNNNASLLARNTVGTLESKVAQKRSKDAGVPKYIWRTQRDERVRPSHRSREGQVFSWDNPPNDGHPGEPYYCRCYAEPYLEDISSMFDE